MHLTHLSVSSPLDHTHTASNSTSTMSEWILLGMAFWGSGQEFLQHMYPEMQFSGKMGHIYFILIDQLLANCPPEWLHQSILLGQYFSCLFQYLGDQWSLWESGKIFGNSTSEKANTIIQYFFLQMFLKKKCLNLCIKVHVLVNFYNILCWVLLFLLRSRLHNVQLTILKCTFQGHLVPLQCCAMTDRLSLVSRCFHHPRWTPYSLKVITLHFLIPPSPDNPKSTFCLNGFTYFAYMES